jgi:Tol biopolymer transport system component
VGRILARSLCLLALGLAGEAGAGRATGPAAAVRVWSGAGPDFITGDISPDGRLLSDVDWDSGDLHIVDLQSGRARRLTGQGYEAGGYAWTSAFSTDGQRVAAAWYLDGANSHELRVYDLNGTDARVVVPAGTGHYYVDPVDWSPSDTEILVAIQDADRTWQLALVAVTSGAVRVVRRLGWQAPGGGHDQAYPDADLSPDGRYVAYDYPPGPAEPTRDIFAVAVDGGRQTTLVAGPGSDRLLGWLPDGSAILFYSDRSGVPAIWRIPVSDGMPAGEPRLIRNGVRGLVPLGFTRAGYAYGVATESQQLHTAVVDPARGRVVGAPQPVPDPVWRKSLAGDWSPDGSRLAYVRHDPLPDPVETIVIVATGGGAPRTVPLTPALHASNGTFRWSVEDRLFLYAYERGRDGIYEVDLRDGGFRRLSTPVSIGRAAIKWFDVGPDGRMVYVIGPPAQPGGEGELVAFDAMTGEHRVLGTARAVRASLAVSPDGKELALLARDDRSRMVELRVMSTSGTAKPRTLFRASRGRLSPPVAWTPDGSRVVVELAANDTPPGLWWVGAAGGQPTLLLADCCSENDVRIHRDGRRLAFVAGADRGEVWLLKAEPSPVVGR